VTLVVDASIATKWVLPEEDSVRAVLLRDQSNDFLAPSLIYAEIGNAVWKRVLWREISAADAIRALETAINLLTRIVPLDDLTIRATEIAIELQHPIYDCFYLALAERERCALVSADGALIAKAKKLKGIEARLL
jgi:predicted nucleic acid-binding protein